MADRFPLIVNAVSQKIEELVSGDNLDLSGNNIVISGDTGAGKYLTSDGTTVSWGSPGDVYLNASQTLTNKTLDSCVISGSINTITNLPNSALVNSGITVNGSTIALGGTVTTPDNNTTYSVSAEDGSSGARKILRLTSGGNFGAGVDDDITLVAGTNMSISRSGDELTFASSYVDTDTITTLQSATGGVAQTGAMVIAAGGSSTVSQDAATRTITISSTYVDTITRLRATTGQVYAPADFTFLDGGATTVSQGVDGNGDPTITYSSVDTITRLKGGGAGSFVTGDTTITGGTNVTVSQAGNTISVASVDTDTVTRLATGANALGSGDFTFVGSGATNVSQATVGGLTTITVTSQNDDTGASLTASSGVLLSGTDFQLKNAGTFTGNTLLKWDSGNTQFTDGIITDNGSTVTINGDLVVEGTQTILNTTTLQVEDNNIELRKGNNLVGTNGGITINRTSDAAGNITSYVQLEWNESVGYWRSFDGSVEKRFVTEGESQVLTNKTLTSPILTAPQLGSATATSINGLIISSTASGELDIATGKKLDIDRDLLLTSDNNTASISINFRQGGNVAYTSDTLATFASTTSTQIRGLVTDTTGTSRLVFQDSPTILTSLNTTSTGFTLLNSTVTNVAAFGGAGIITMGQTGGTFTINQNLVVNEDLTVGSTISDNITLNGTVNSENADILIRGTSNDPMRVGRGNSAVSTNTAVGVQALNSITSGSQNTGYGYQALFTTNSGAANTAIGNRALRANGVGSNNVAIGRDSMLVSLDGTKNVAIGNNTLESNSGGDANVCIGHYAGFDVLGNGNVLIGPADNENSGDVTFRPPNISGDRQLVIGSGGQAWIRGDANYDITIDEDLTVSKDILVKGNLTVQGVQTTVKSNIVQITDKNIELASVVSTQFVATVTDGTPDLTAITPTAGLIPGMEVSTTTGGITIPNNTFIVSITNNTAVLSNNVTGNGQATITAIGPSDNAAEDGGIIVKGNTDKSILWKGTDAGVTYNTWVSSENFDLAANKKLTLNSICVADPVGQTIGPVNGTGTDDINLSGGGTPYALGSAVTTSSLTSLGTLTTFRNSGNAKVSGNTTIDPDAFPASVIAGSIQDGSGWGATGIGGNGSSTGDTWALAHNGSKLYLAMGDGSSDNSLETIVQFDPGNTGLVDFTADRRIKIRSTGLTITDDAAGIYTINGAHLTIGDTTTEGDLQLFHDSGSNNSFISERGTGDLCLVTNGTNLYLQKDATAATAEDFIHCIANDAVKLYFNGSAAPNYDPCAQTIQTNGVKGFLVGDPRFINTNVSHGEFIVRRNLASPANAALGQCARMTIITNEQTGGVNGYGGAVFFGSQDVDSSDQYTSDLAAIAGSAQGADTGDANKNGDLDFFTRNGVALTVKFRIKDNGDLFGTDTTISSLSDVRLKENIDDFTYDLSKFKQLKPKTFNWKHQDWHVDLPSSGKHRGFIAQDLELVDEELVKSDRLQYESPENDLVDDGTAKTSDLGRIDAMYVSVIQQLMDKIEVLEDKVAQLEGN